MMFATGAGAASRHSLGTGIVGGMIGVSTLALLFVPVFYVWFEGFAERTGGRRAVKLAANLAKRNIPITEKIRNAILRSSGEAFDVNAKVAVTADGQVTVTNSPDFSEDKLNSRDLGVPGQDGNRG
jgi:multidrug efflux pump